MLADPDQRTGSDFMGFYKHLPFIAPLAKFIVDENYVDSFKRWADVLLLLNAVNVYLLINMLDIKKFTKDNLFILCMGAFFFEPTFSGFMNGQDIAILLFGAIVWTRGCYPKIIF